jgi:hypothetical protein
MNQAAFDTRRKLVQETWPRAVTVRNRNFLNAKLHVDVSNKHDLTVTIRELPSSVSLAHHAEGGVKVPEKARNLSIPPSGTVVRTARGVRADQRPRAILANTPKRALRVTSRGIFVGSGGRLHLKFAFKPSAQQPADVPFHADFERFMKERLFELLPAALQQAGFGSFSHPPAPLEVRRPSTPG